ncbi:rhamnulokinase [Salirhabdus salicampi]|uniref:rhamnulokinase n=1 Tax=Salirhabdus salicampi TaxID=476102 RepID=UPI0020C40B7C|nr:rhamnulokinase [Salirhabdus salicampi]
MKVLAIDLGASSGKILLGKLENDCINITEVHRFDNTPVKAGKQLYWDILRIYHEIKIGLKKAFHEEKSIESIAIDSWAIDFGLLDENGLLLGNPLHYRDHHTDGAIEEVTSIVGAKELYEKTGIQFIQINTIYQLYALQKNQSRILKEATSLLMIPDLIRYFLTGKKYNEFTNVTTTQLYNPVTNKWNKDIMEQLNIPTQIFNNPLVKPGTHVGDISEDVVKELNIPKTKVLAIGEHDTASAVAGVPSTHKDFIYLSCGTWSLMGTEVDEPYINEATYQANFTNEGGIEDTFRLLKNIMGLWIVQECKRIWDLEGNQFDYRQLVLDAKNATPFRSLINPDDERFFNPLNMIKEIQSFCQETEQPIPETVGQIVRCILESLAFKYRYTYEKISSITNKEYEGLYIVGGGIQNELLCQFTANALGKSAWVGPQEATSYGNIAMQFIANNHIKDLDVARKMIRNSIRVKTYIPSDFDIWDSHYRSFCNKYLK